MANLELYQWYTKQQILDHLGIGKYEEYDSGKFIRTPNTDLCFFTLSVDADLTHFEDYKTIKRSQSDIEKCEIKTIPSFYHGNTSNLFYYLHGILLPSDIFESSLEIPPFLSMSQGIFYPPKPEKPHIEEKFERYEYPSNKTLPKIFVRNAKNFVDNWMFVGEGIGKTEVTLKHPIPEHLWSKVGGFKWRIEHYPSKYFLAPTSTQAVNFARQSYQEEMFEIYAIHPNIEFFSLHVNKERGFVYFLQSQEVEASLFDEHEKEIPQETFILGGLPFETPRNTTVSRQEAIRIFEHFIMTYTLANWVKWAIEGKVD